MHAAVGKSEEQICQASIQVNVNSYTYLQALSASAAALHADPCSANAKKAGDVYRYGRPRR